MIFPRSIVKCRKVIDFYTRPLPDFHSNIQKMAMRRKILVALTLPLAFIIYCESTLLGRLQSPLKKAVPRVENITDDIQHNIDNLLTFDMFKQLFRKTYSSVNAEHRALRNFLFNQKDINRHNIEYTAGHVSFTRALWDYSDLSVQEVNRYMNGFKRPVMTKASENSENEVKVPKSLNWVTKGFVTKGI